MSMWEIRETDDYRHEPKFESRYGSRSDYKMGRKGMSGRKDDSFDEGYECGYEEGYRAAMKEAKSFYERR